MGNVDRARQLFESAAGDPAGARESLLRALSDDDRLVRLTAAVQVACHRLAPLPPAVAREMLDTLLGETQRVRSEPPVYEEYAEATATEDDSHDLGQDLAQALARLPAGSFDWAVVPLVELWRQDRQFYDAALAAVALAFAPADVAPPAERLTDDQRRVLAALAEDEPIWSCCGDTVPMLEGRGLPSSRAAMGAFLAGHPAGGGPAAT